MQNYLYLCIAKLKTMTEKLKFFPIGLVVVALGVVAWCMLHYEENLLWKVQELNLFLDTPLFFKQQMVVPGGMLTYLGTFFTEFFYHAWQGVLLLCAWWGLLVWLSSKAFRVPVKWLTLLLIPVVLLLATNMELGYWIYYLKLRGYYFVATIGLTLAMAAVWGFRCVPSKVRVAYVVVSALVLYPLLGAYGLLAVVLMGLLSWQHQEMSILHRGINCVVALLLAFLVPKGYYWLVYYQTSIDDIYMAALPVFAMDKTYMQYYVPFVLLGVFYLLLCLPVPAAFKKKADNIVIWATCQVLLLVGGMTYGVKQFWYRDYNFEKELEMRHALEQEDWEGMVRAAVDLQDEPTRAIVLMKNLALFRLGRQGDEMYHYRTGSKPYNTPLKPNMTQIVGRVIYYQYGQLNYCYRWCLEDGVEYGWRAEYLKYMTRCALLNEEYAVAAKYIGLLKHTRFHKAWAEEQEQYLRNPEKLNDDKNYAIIKRLKVAEDHLGSDKGLAEMYLMNVLLDVNTRDPLVQELTLLSALWQKDISMFWPRFSNYAMLHAGEHMPKHYQEAAYLYGHLEQQVDISHMPFDADVVQNYEEFMQLAQRCAGMSEEQMKPIFYPRFGQTFYYEYFLIRNQKTN